MHRSLNKFFVYLLAILLGVAPLQGAIAVPSGGDSHTAMTVMADSEQMLAMSEMADASSPCDLTDDCHSDGCAFGHCAAGIADVYIPTANTAATTLGVYLPQLRVQFFSQYFHPLYRPPKA
jgi:hypothetical protein